MGSDPLADDLAGMARGGVDPLADDLSRMRPAPEARPDKGAMNAAGMGVLQGASFGFFDEAAAALKALAEGRETGRGGPSFTQRYHANVGEERAQLRAAQEQHPIASTVGQLAGGVVAPGFGLGAAAGLGRGIAGAAARGAGAGILSGAGASEANSMGGVVSDAAKGGLMGAAIGGTVGYGLERVLRGAPERVDSRTLQAITGGRATTAGKRVYADDDLVLAAAKKFGLEPEGADPRALATAVETARKQVGKQLETAYGAIDHESLGVRTSDIRRAVGRVKSALDSPSDEPVRRQLDSYAESMAKRWGEGARDRVPLQAMNKEIGKLQKVGFAGADLSPAAGAQLKRDLARSLDDVLDSRLEEIKDLGGRIAKSSLAQREGWKGMATAAEASQALPSLNRDYRGLRLIQDIADQRAAMPPANQAAGGLRNALNNAVDVGLAFTHPVAFAAKKLALPAAQAGGRAADRALARLYEASQAGRVTAQLVQDALENGVPRGLISRLAPGVVTSPSDEASP